MAASILRRGQTYFVRVTLPPDRWADVGRAMGARAGLRREVVKTLGTTDRKEASSRIDAAASTIIQDVEAALRRAKLRPLTDWTADWMSKAHTLNEAWREGRDEVIHEEVDERGRVIGEETAGTIMIESIEAAAEQVHRRQGRQASDQFVRIATKPYLSVAEGAERWLEEERRRVRGGTVVSHEAALKWLGRYLAAEHDISSLEAAAFSDITRRMAGAAVQERRKDKAWETVSRDFSAWNGLWRWAVRRGFTDANPWTDQTTGIKAPREHDEGRGQERGYTTEELVKLLSADPELLAPSGGAYASTFFDVIRLLLLTGARAGEIMDLRVGDVLEDGKVVILAGARGKTTAATRLMPLHPFARRVVADRLASLPDHAPGASLWPEVPPQGPDRRRSKPISTLYVPLRARILGESQEVDLHSFRRTLLTAAETALHNGGRINAELIPLLGGHKRSGLALSLYSDWNRIGRPAFKGALKGRLKTLQEAMEDVVAIGFDETIRVALAATADDRPGVKRVAPAFVRKP